MKFNVKRMMETLGRITVLVVIGKNCLWMLKLVSVSLIRDGIFAQILSICP